MKDRNVEFPNRFRMTKVEGTDDIYDLIPAPGEVIAPGDTFSEANMLPDFIPALLGLKMANPQVKDALNVLAHVGNLHVWERVQTYSEEVPAGYTLGGEINGFLYVRKAGSANKYYEMTIQYGRSIGVTDDGTVYISSATSYTNYPGSTDMQNLLKTMAGKYFKIVKFTYPDYFTSYVDELVYIPATATITFDSNNNMQTDYQVVTGNPAIPAGTTTDYLTSTDRNAYPDQSAAGGQDAYYTLGDVVTGSFMIGSTASGYITTWRYGTSVSISDDGTLSLSGTTGTVDGTSSLVSDYSVLNGKFVYVNSNYSNIALNDGKIYFIPSDANIKTDGSMFANMMLDKYQPVHGHAAIPANTTITYLGQLGNRTRIETGSYVGTRTYGSSNPNTLTFGFEPKIVFVVGRVFLDTSNTKNQLGVFNMLALTDEYLQAGYFEYDTNNVSSPSGSKYAKKNGNTLSWYSNNSTSQLNGTWSGEVSIYTYFAFA